MFFLLFSLDAVLESNLNHIKALLGLMIVMKKKLRKEMLDDMILSESHTASSTFIHFLEKIDDEIKTIKDDITQLNTVSWIWSICEILGSAY